MKKLLILALALTLTLALSISVFAAGGRVVGEEGSDPSYDDGWTATDPKWDTAASDVQVDIIVTTNAYESRYAVDIEYNPITFNVAASNMVWDVNELQYVPKEGQSALTQPADQTITVKNYSDQPVTVTSQVDMDDVNYANCPMDISATPSITVAKAKAATASEAGAAATGTVTISVTAENNDWDKVATYFAPHFEGGVTSLVVATVSLTITK